jgi:hypothetical protein
MPLIALAPTATVAAMVLTDALYWQAICTALQTNPLA